MASGGNGAPSHVAGESFKMMAGVEWCMCLSRRGARPHRPACRTGASVLWPRPLVDRTHQDRQAACSGGDHGGARGGAAGHSDRRRLPAGLRGQHLGRDRVPNNTPAGIVERLNKEINAVEDDPRLKAGLPTWAPRCWRARPPTSANTWGRRSRDAGQMTGLRVIAHPPRATAPPARSSRAESAGGSTTDVKLAGIALICPPGRLIQEFVETFH